MIRGWVGKIIWGSLKAAGRCLAAFLMHKYLLKERGNVKMASVKITVVNGTKLLEGAKVRYTINGVEESVLTGADGSAEITGLTAGSYVFKGSLDNYTDGSITVMAAEDAEATGIITLKVYSVAAITAGASTEEAISDLTDALNTRIANSRGAAKYAYIVLLLLLSVKSETMVKFVKNKLS
jgi:hypothetical protein